MLTRKQQQLMVLLCAILLFLLTALQTKDEVTMAGNESSRFGTIQALAEQNTFELNQTVFRTVDRINIGNRLYSDKPLMLMVFHSMIFKVIAVVTGIGFATHYYLSVYLTNLIGIGLLNIILFLLFFRRLDRDVNAPFFSKLFLSSSLLFGTLLWSYGVAMNNHTPAALLFFILFLQMADYPENGSIRHALLLGLTAGGLTTVEIPIGGLAGLGAFLVVAHFSAPRQKWRQTAVYAVGGILPLFAMGIINYLATGRFRPQYLGQGGTFQPAILFSLDYWWNILFWNRGFFSYMPDMLFIIPVLLRKQFRAGIRAKETNSIIELIMMSVVAAIILFYGLLTGEYGGWAYGFRYLVPIIPIVWFFIARTYASSIRSGKYAVLCLLIVWGAVTACVGAYNPWCNSYEGHRTGSRSAEYYVRSTFAGNLLCMSFEHNPESALSHFMINRYYHPVIATGFLNQSFVNTKKIDQLLALREYCRRHPETQEKLVRTRDDGE